MAASVDYYKVLGIAPTATASEIKTAYHQAAKRSHPDAGGSAEAMQLVNEAYAELSDPTSRRDYDAYRPTAAQSRPSAPPAPSPHRPPPAPRPAAPHPAAGHRGPVHQPHPSDQLPRLTALARRSAWRIIGYNATAAVLIGFVTAYMYNFATDPVSQIILALAAFVPVYFLTCGIVFLFRPRLRIALARLGALRVPPLRDLMGLLVLGLAALPLAAIWLIGYVHGLFR